jgi:hypothetical protein
LNLKSGGNTKITYAYANYPNFRNNPNLMCISVDNTAFANANWSSKKDASANFSENCTLGVPDSVLNTITVYPNPTSGIVHIDNALLEKVIVYDVLGNTIKTVLFHNNTSTNSIDLSSLSKGTYFLLLKNMGLTSTRKIIIE